MKTHKEIIENLGKRHCPYFPELLEDGIHQIHCAHRIPSWKNKNRSMPKHIIIKLQNIKDKEEILKVVIRKRKV